MAKNVAGLRIKNGLLELLDDKGEVVRSKQATSGEIACYGSEHSLDDQNALLRALWFECNHTERAQLVRNCFDLVLTENGPKTPEAVADCHWADMSDELKKDLCSQFISKGLTAVVLCKSCNYELHDCDDIECSCINPKCVQSRLEMEQDDAD